MRLRGSDGWSIAILTSFTAATRGWLFGNYLGEPDSALFPIGVWRWMNVGPQTSRVYDRSFSGGYYALCAALAQWRQVSLAQLPLMMNEISFLAALAAAPLAYLLARLWIGRTSAFWATLTWIASPAMWWIGIEPHPQGLAITLMLGSLYLFFRGIVAEARTWRVRLVWFAGSLASLIASLLVRCDGLFLAGVYLLAPAVRDHDCQERDVLAFRRTQWRAAAGLVGLGIGGWLGVRAYLLSAVNSNPNPEPSVWRQIIGYMGSLSWSHQLLPLFTAAGLLCSLFAVTGIAVGGIAFGRNWLHAWGKRLVVWSFPAMIFWVALRGNNVRHVALFVRPWLWAGIEGLRFCGARRMISLALLALMLDPIVVPASSNVTLYPSGNVVASARLLRDRQRALMQAGTSLARTPPPVCYFGSYTSPYVLFGLLAAAPSSRVEVSSVRTWVWPGNNANSLVLFHDVYSSEEYRREAMACARPFSFEYDNTGQPYRFLGAEWSQRLLPRRWIAHGVGPTLGLWTAL